VLTLIHLLLFSGIATAGLKSYPRMLTLGARWGRREMPEIGGILAPPVGLSSPFGINTGARFGCDRPNDRSFKFES